MSEQITFATSDFASNPEPRCPCILLLDVSGSMNGRPINELNAGLVTFRDELLADPLALKRVELGIVTFGPVHVEQPFTSAANFFPPHPVCPGRYTNGCGHYQSPGYGRGAET